MTSVEQRRWPLRRWLIVFALVLAVQIALVFSLRNSSPIVPRKPDAAPLIHLAENSTNEWLALNDPTLFALPHQEGFSGEAWLKIPPLEFHPAGWSELTLPLPLPVAQLGARLKSFVETNNTARFEIAVKPAPELTLPEIPPVTPISTRSTLRIEGDLASRRLISPLELRAWPASDILTNSVVQLMVDALGKPISEVLLAGSGSKEADQQALELAMRARFEPVEVAGPGREKNPDTAVTLGTLVFEWQTIPVPSTNTTTTPAIQ